MNVINYIVNNWDFVLLIAAALAAVVFFAFKGNKSVVMKMLYALVTEAEKELGSGTGSLKLATVVASVYPKLPTIIKTFISEKTLTQWIEEALTEAKDSWQKNTNIAGYIAGPAQNAQDDAQDVGNTKDK